MPSIGRAVKESIVEELAARLRSAPHIFVTAVSRLRAPEADRLRQNLAGSQARLFMTKRRLARRAAEALGIPGLAELIQGPVGLVITSDDALKAAKLLVEFRKTHEDQFAVRGAIVEGQCLNGHRVEELASLPTKPVLLAHVLASIESPLADVVFTIEGLIGEVAWLVEQLTLKKPDAPGGATSGAAAPSAAAASPPDISAASAEPPSRPPQAADQ